MKLFEKIKKTAEFYIGYWACIKEETQNLSAEERGYREYLKREKRRKRVARRVAQRAARILARKRKRKLKEAIRNYGE